MNELILDGFFTKKNEFKQKNLTIKEFINTNVYNEKFPDIKSYKSIFGGDKTEICGFYTLFFSLNYIKYILNERDIYYIYKNTNRKSFFKFYKNFLSFFISNMPSLEQYEITELNNGSSLERHHIDFILKNNLLFKYMGKKYDDLNDDKKYNFEFEWFDFISNNFSISEIPKINKLNDIFKKISQNVKDVTPSKNNNVIFLYIGLIEHWILIIYDSYYKDILIEIDSFEGTRDIINLKYLDEKEIQEYIDKENDINILLTKKPPSEYSIKQFKNFIKDTQRLLYKLNYFVLKNDNDKISLGLSIIEERCNSFLESFNNLNIDKNDKLNELLIIYYWFANEYHSKRIKEDFYYTMKEYKVSQKNCYNKNINKFFALIKELRDFLNENIKLIDQNDIKEILVKGFDIFDKINKL